ncbi:CoA transferase [Nocardiopsis sp. CC223A]|uniref:CoA transferase n=1 Tax=Nocardiopsis sp. CC223A TaxID=3044051 RepID=UPI00278BE4E7|nr:CoA transferase [Nocardiopsis sp. CC223A]
MTSTVPLTPVPLAGVEPISEGGGALHRRTLDHLRLLGASPTGAGSAPDTDHSRLSSPRGTGAVLAWTGPDTGGHGTETGLQAAAGLMAVHGRRRGRPEALPVDLVGTVAATAHVTGFLAAELLRLRTGRARTVRTRADACALVSVSQYLAAAAADDGEAVPLSPGTATLTTADGADFEIEALTPEPWARFWADLGAPERAAGAGWTPFQFRYATACCPLPRELRGAAARAPWERVRAAAGRHGLGLVRLGPPSTGSPDGVPVRTSRPTGPGRGTAPAADGDPPLHGVRVLEAGRRIQAPLAAHLLRLLGAEVVRIEPPGGDPLRGMPPTCGDLSARWLALNDGKDAVEADIKSASGRADLLGLVRDADVFLHNWAPGTAERLGLDADAMAAVRPGLVYVHTSGWGGPGEDLPPGTDFMVQARTGLTAPGEDTATTVASLMTVLDVLGGFLGAQTAVAALLEGGRLGAGVAAESSLRGAARLLAGARRPGAPAVGEGERGPVVEDPDTGAAHPVTTDLTALEHDPRFTGLLSRTADGLLSAASPWEVL